jgi:hypothetical protein
VGANADPYLEQTWAGDYSGRGHPYDCEGGNPAAAMNRDPLDSYIWDRLADRHLSFRNYGFYETGKVFNASSAGFPAAAAAAVAAAGKASAAEPRSADAATVAATERVSRAGIGSPQGWMRRSAAVSGAGCRSLRSR